MSWSESLPAVAARNVTVRVSAAVARPLRRGHPWLFDRGIVHLSHDGAPGARAVVFDDASRKLVGVGLWDPHSPIRVKMLHAAAGKPRTIDATFFAERVAEALALRAPLLAAGDTDGYRAVFGESDGLPGFVADCYAGTLVVKLYSEAWGPWLPTVLELLRAALAPERIVLRLARALQGAGISALGGLRDGDVLEGPALPAGAVVVFRENGLRFECDPVRGQKTGFFLDQRDNRSRVEALSGGCEVLNVFSYSGGFSLYAARGGARTAVSLDLNPLALAAAQRNFALNVEHDPAVAACHHECLEGDAFERLEALAASRRRFDVVVIDPPAFARREEHASRALQAYARLVELGLGVLSPGGRLVLASCSSRVSAEDFRANALAAAARAGRPLREVVATGHALDHPVRESFPEAAYLKALFATA